MDLENPKEIVFLTWFNLSVAEAAELDAEYVSGDDGTSHADAFHTAHDAEYRFGRCHTHQAPRNR